MSNKLRVRLLAGGRWAVLCLALGVVGCQSSERTSSTRSGESAAVGGEKDSPIVADDTDRASAELDEQNQERSNRGARPATGNDRSGTRVVDQPRVGGSPR